MTEDEFDKKIIETAKSFGNDPNITYNYQPSSELQGNCNSSTSTILLKSGVSKEQVKRIGGKIPGISWGFSTKAKPWTKIEQKNASTPTNIMLKYRRITF